MDEKTLDRTTVIKKKGWRNHSVQIWISELRSWLVFDGFKSKKMAQEFISDPKEQAERENYIKRTLKKNGNEKKKKTRVSNTKDIKEIKK